MGVRGSGEEKELAPFLTRPFKRLSSRLSSSGLIRVLLVSWKSRIKDQGSVENISNKLPLRDSGFPGKTGSRIKDQGSWFLIRLFQESGCYRRKQIKWWVIFARYFGLQHTRFYWSRSTKDPADPHWFVLVVLPSQESPWGSLGSSDGSWESPRVLKEFACRPFELLYPTGIL